MPKAILCLALSVLVWLSSSEAQAGTNSFIPVCDEINAAGNLVCPAGTHYNGRVFPEDGVCGGEGFAGILCGEDPSPGDYPFIRFGDELVDAYTRCMVPPPGVSLPSNPTFMNFREVEAKPVCPAGFDLFILGSGGRCEGTIVECRIDPQVMIDDLLGRARERLDADPNSTIARIILLIYHLTGIDPSSAGCSGDVGCDLSRQILATLTAGGPPPSLAQPQIVLTEAELLHLNELFIFLSNLGSEW
jgi:hypothetical protein